jgi:hypothetical protein
MLTVDQKFIDEFLALAGLDLNVTGVAGDILRRCATNAIERPDRPIFLPLPSATETVWYVMARSHQQERILRDQVKAFLSFPFSSYDGTRGDFDPTNKLDALMVATFGDLVFKVQVGKSPVVRSGFNNALKRLLDLLDAQPERSLEMTRPIQRIRQDFEWALQARDEIASKQYFEELTANGRLSQENIWYLQIQRWAALGHWNDIIHHPDLADLLYLRRPSSVTYAILRAYHEVYLVDQQIDDNVRSDLLRQEPLAGLAGIRLLLDGNLPADIAAIYLRLQTLLGNNAQDSPPQLIVDSPEAMPLSGLDLAEEMWKLGEFVDALTALDDCQDGVRKLALLLRICRDAPTPDLIARVSVDTSAASDEVISVLRKKKETSDLLDWLALQVVGHSIPRSLHDWLQAFASNATDAQLEETIREYGEAWNCGVLAGKDTELIASEMENILNTTRVNLLLRILPLIHGLIEDLQPNVKLPVLRSSFLTLALEEHLTAADLDALHHVVDVLMEYVNVVERREILTEVLNVWLRVASPRRVSWMLDIAASIKTTSGLQDNVLDDMDMIIQMASVVSGFMPGSVEDGLKPNASVILEGIFDLAAWENCWQISIVGDQEQQDPFLKLQNKRVGIYCLESSRAQRMSAVLASLCNCTIDLNSDYAGTKALENLAKNSDVMVVITSAAKHAATDCIRVNRGDGPMIYIHSTGVSTFLRCVSEYLKNN